MNYTSTSILVILVATLGISAYDVLPALSDPEGDTISAVMRAWSREWWIIAYLWGLLGGHWFGGDPTPVDASVPWLVWSTWVLFIVNFATRDVQLSPWVYLLVLIAGWLSGHFLWSQA